MMNQLDYVLVALAFFEYAFLVIFYLHSKDEIPNDATIESAFQLLEKKLKQSYPTLPTGFTWEEKLSKVRAKTVGDRSLDWNEIEQTLQKYESLRFGGGSDESANVRAILKLVRKL